MNEAPSQTGDVLRLDRNGSPLAHPTERPDLRVEERSTPFPLPPTLSITQLARALAKAQQRCKAAARDREHAHLHYRYASAEAIVTEARAALAETGLSLLPVEQSVLGNAQEGWQLRRRFLLLHESGEALPLAGQWPIVPDGAKRPLDKAAAIAVTLSLSYLLRDLLLMPRGTGEDEEPIPVPSRASREQLDRIDAALLQLHIKPASIAKRLRELFGVSSPGELTPAQAEHLEAMIRQAQVAKEKAPPSATAV
jgi:hypothetical protein